MIAEGTADQPEDRPVPTWTILSGALKVPDLRKLAPSGSEKFLISRFFATLLATASLMVASTPVQAQSDSAADPMLALRAFDARVATIGHRIAVASLDLCSQIQWRPGVALHALSQYSGRSREAAARDFGLDRGPGVLALAAGGPAERAGLRIDDILLAVDGAALPTPEERS